jgi:acetylornithine deacetylase
MNKIEWLSRLVSHDTTSSNSNLNLIDDIDKWFSQHKIGTRLTRNPEETKANLFATLPAHDGRIEGGLILSGHTDVVPVTGQCWDSDPFIATQIENKMYGRGTCDMKGFLAVVLALVPEFQRMQLPVPVHFAFSYDEEVGCLGAPLMIADLKKAGINPAACVVGEPTEMRPVVGHKGIQVFRCRVQGHAAHSSLTTQGCNAIEYAAQLICHLRGIANNFRQQGPFENDFDVPFTTLSTNMITGGNADNIIPSLCEFVFEFRHLTQVKPKNIVEAINEYVRSQLLPLMQREKSSASIEIDNIAVVPSFEGAETSALTQLVRAISGEKEIRKVAYATEAGQFEQAHIPTIVCGPGSIDQAHRANEYVLVSHLEKCDEFLRAVVRGNFKE